VADAAGAVRAQPVDRTGGAGTQPRRRGNRLLAVRQPEVDERYVETLTSGRSDDPRTARRPEALVLRHDVGQVARRLDSVDHQVTVVAA